MSDYFETCWKIMMLLYVVWSCIELGRIRVMMEKKGKENGW
jgi:hypothetical protein